jgi:uncharacterized protein
VATIEVKQTLIAVSANVVNNFIKPNASVASCGNGSGCMQCNRRSNGKAVASPSWQSRVLRPARQFQQLAKNSSLIHHQAQLINPAKDDANQTKHGVSLALALELDWEAALVWVDERFEYNEIRMIALAPKTNILYYVAFVDRGAVRRIISLRRANRREVKHYAQSL